MKSSQHYYVIEDPSGKFHAKQSAKHGVTHGRFSNLISAQEHAAKLRRNFLSSALNLDGNELAIPDRVKLAVWTPSLYQEALARGRRVAQTKAYNAAAEVNAL